LDFAAAKNPLTRCPLGLAINILSHGDCLNGLIYDWEMVGDFEVFAGLPELRRFV
jgi:hypothetical protein